MNIIQNNESSYLIIIVVLALVAYCVFNDDVLDKFSTQGALTQLHAKGPQDMYLTGDAYRNLLYRPYGYPNFLWNNSTRMHGYYPYRRSYYPHYLRRYGRYGMYRYPYYF